MFIPLLNIPLLFRISSKAQAWCKSRGISRTMKLSRWTVRGATAVLLGCLVPLAYAVLVAHASSGERFIWLGEIPTWINHQLPHFEPWDDHIARYRQAGWLVFDALLVLAGTVVCLALLPSRLVALPGIAALFVPATAVVVFWWLADPHRPRWVLVSGPLVALALAFAWARLVIHRKHVRDRRPLLLFALVLVAGLGALGRDLYFYLLIFSAYLTFASSVLLLAAWYEALTSDEAADAA